MRRIEVDDVVGLAVQGIKRAPVGIVVDADDSGIELDLFSWLTGSFSAGHMLVQRRDIRAIVWAAVDYYDRDDVPVYDMEPLDSFQKSWQTA